VLLDSINPSIGLYFVKESNWSFYLHYPCLEIHIVCFDMQEVQRIKLEHPDDDQCIVNDRVKGRLKVTRAFGAGYLKQVTMILLSWLLRSSLVQSFFRFQLLAVS
jgi:hypothetical protein